MAQKSCSRCEEYRIQVENLKSKADTYFAEAANMMGKCISDPEKSRVYESIVAELGWLKNAYADLQAKHKALQKEAEEWKARALHSDSYAQETYQKGAVLQTVVDRQGVIVNALIDALQNLRPKQ